MDTSSCPLQTHVREHGCQLFIAAHRDPVAILIFVWGRKGGKMAIREKCGATEGGSGAPHDWFDGRRTEFCGSLSHYLMPRFHVNHH